MVKLTIEIGNKMTNTSENRQISSLRKFIAFTFETSAITLATHLAFVLGGMTVTNHFNIANYSPVSLGLGVLFGVAISANEFGLLKKITYACVPLMNGLLLGNLKANEELFETQTHEISRAYACGERTSGYVRIEGTKSRIPCKPN